MAMILERAEMLLRAEQKAGKLSPRFDPQLKAVALATELRLQRIEATITDLRSNQNRHAPTDTRTGGTVLDGES